MLIYICFAMFKSHQNLNNTILKEAYVPCHSFNKHDLIQITEIQLIN